MIPALRWVAMRAILMFKYEEVMGKVTRQCPQTTNRSVYLLFFASVWHCPLLEIWVALPGLGTAAVDDDDDDDDESS